MGDCTICGRGQRARDRFCQRCTRNLERERTAEKRRKAHQGWQYKLWKAIHWKGYLVGLYENGGSCLNAQALTVAVGRVPKSMLVDLDKYCPGYDRQQVKKMKRAVAQVYGL